MPPRSRSMLAARTSSTIPRSTAGRRSPSPSATTCGCTGSCRPRSRRSTSRRPATTSSSRQPRTDVSRWEFLTQLHDSNEVLFYRLVGDHVDEMLPIVYTPTVGTAIEQFSHLFRRPRGALPERRRRRRDRPDARRDRARRGRRRPGRGLRRRGDPRHRRLGGRRHRHLDRQARRLHGGGRHRSRRGSWRWVWTSAPIASRSSTILATWACAAPAFAARSTTEFIDAYVDSASRHFPNAILHWEDFGGAAGPRDPRPIRRHVVHVRRRHPGHRLGRPRVRPGRGPGVRVAPGRPADRGLRGRIRRSRRSPT